MLTSALALAAALTLTGPAPATIDVRALGTPDFTSGLQERICDDQTDATCPQAAPHWRPVLGSGGALSESNRDGGANTTYVDPTFRGVQNGALGSKPLGLDPFTLRPTYLAITAWPTPASVKPLAFGEKKDFLSGVITSKFLRTFTYGYIEVTANLPVCTKGAWPAIWLVATKGPWPTGGEIDFPEGIGTGVDWFSLHTATTPQGGTHTLVPAPEGCAGKPVWHRYGALKTPTTIAMYLDGKRVSSQAASADMNQPMYLILNLAMGGSWATGASGKPDLAPVFAYFSSVRLWSLDDEPR